VIWSRVSGTVSEAGIKRVGGDPGKALPEGWQETDPKTGAPVGISKGWDYAPGASVAAVVTTLSGKLGALPERPSVDLIQSWLRAPLFAEWMAAPSDAFPLVRIAALDAERIGASKTVAVLSAETAAKQLREHPELSVFEYADAQRVVDLATQVIQDTPLSLIYILEETGTPGHILIVKATRTGNGLFVKSFRRISGDAAERARLLRQFIRRSVK